MLACHADVATSRQALYGYYPAGSASKSDEESERGCCWGLCCCCGGGRKKKHALKPGAVTAVAAADVLTDEGAGESRELCLDC